MAAPNNPLRILCFGDSLTSGYHSWGSDYHPYATRLKERLEQRFPARDIDISTDGLPGDTVIDGSFMSRLDSCLGQVNRYDWIIILGGTNDLGWGRKADDIVKALELVWSKALNSGANVLALNVAASRVCSSVGGFRRMRDINEKISAHREDRFFTLDLCSSIPWPEDDSAEQDRLWDDGLHFTPAGYDLIGDVVAERLIALLE